MRSFSLRRYRNEKEKKKKTPRAFARRLSVFENVKVEGGGRRRAVFRRAMSRLKKLERSPLRLNMREMSDWQFVFKRRKPCTRTQLIGCVKATNETRRITNHAYGNA